MTDICSLPRAWRDAFYHSYEQMPLVFFIQCDAQPQMQLHSLSCRPGLNFGAPTSLMFSGGTSDTAALCHLCHSWTPADPSLESTCLTQSSP